ncbi:unnamed protein product, partial [Meganyctiphanes norvegica]
CAIQQKTTTSVCIMEFPFRWMYCILFLDFSLEDLPHEDFISTVIKHQPITEDLGHSNSILDTISGIRSGIKQEEKQSSQITEISSLSMTADIPKSVSQSYINMDVNESNLVSSKNIT